MPETNSSLPTYSSHTYSAQRPATPSTSTVAPAAQKMPERTQSPQLTYSGSNQQISQSPSASGATAQGATATQPATQYGATIPHNPNQPADVYSTGSQIQATEIDPIQAQQQKQLMVRDLEARISSLHTYSVQLQNFFGAQVGLWNRDIISRLSLAQPLSSSGSTGNAPEIQSGEASRNEVQNVAVSAALPYQISSEDIQKVKFQLIATPNKIDAGLQNALPDKVTSKNLSFAGFNSSILPPFKSLLALDMQIEDAYKVMIDISSAIIEAQSLGVSTETLEQTKESLKLQTEQMEILHKQAKRLAELFTAAKTLNVMLSPEGGKYIQDNLLGRYLLELKQASDPVGKARIALAFKDHVCTMLGDMQSFQTDTFEEINKEKSKPKSTASMTPEERQLQQIFEKKISQVMNAMFLSCGLGVGEMILSEEKSQLNSLPKAAVLAPKQDQSQYYQHESWHALFEFFGKVRSGQAVMTLKALELFVGELIEAKEINLSTSSQTPPQTSLSAGEDNSLIILSSVKTVFDDFYQPSAKVENGMSCSLMIGMAVFAQDEVGQADLETLLSQEKYKQLFPEMLNTNMSPAILSRIMFLYNNFNKQQLAFIHGKTASLS
jgi:hypothetical protein